MKKIGLALLCFLSSSFVYAMSCEVLIDQIYTQMNQDLKKHPTPQQQKNVPWKQFTWLEKNLGHADDTSVVETLYQWNHASLLMRNEKMVAGINLSNQAGPYPSITDINSALGEEPRQVMSVTLHEYRWICANSSSYLKVLVDNKQTVIEMTGQRCMASSSRECIAFSANGTPSELAMKMRQPLTPLLPLKAGI